MRGLLLALALCGGACALEPPPDPPAAPRGTLVYRDGILVAVIERAELGGDHLVPESAATPQPRWSLLPILASLGLEVGDLAAAELVGRDGAVRRVEAALLADEEFSPVLRSGGRIRLHRADAEVSALRLHSRAGATTTH
jgi:hypothetical protein